MADVYEVVEPTPEQVEQFISDLRDDDRREVEALGAPVSQAIHVSIEGSQYLRAAIVEDGKVAALWGLAASTILSTKARPWCLTSNAIEGHTKDFLKQSRHEVRHMLEAYPHLSNFVDARYTGAVKWLRWLGFTITETRELGPEGVPFHLFEQRRP